MKNRIDAKLPTKQNKWMNETWRIEEINWLYATRMHSFCNLFAVLCCIILITDIWFYTIEKRETISSRAESEIEQAILNSNFVLLLLLHKLKNDVLLLLSQLSQCNHRPIQKRWGFINTTRYVLAKVFEDRAKYYCLRWQLLNLMILFKPLEQLLIKVSNTFF